MRSVDIGSKRFTEVNCLDKPGAGGACHKYQVVTSIADKPPGDYNGQVYATVNFQNGAIQEAGVNGCHNEDLIAIVIDRLRGFQMGEFNCRDNAVALTHLETALLWLNKRTNERMSRGVEGKSVA